MAIQTNTIHTTLFVI